MREKGGGGGGGERDRERQRSSELWDTITAFTSFRTVVRSARGQSVRSSNSCSASLSVCLSVCLSNETEQQMTTTLAEC